MDSDIADREVAAGEIAVADTDGESVVGAGIAVIGDVDDKGLTVFGHPAELGVVGVD